MNIIIDLQNAIYDGMELKFRSPVDCSQVTGLKVYYNNKQASMEFAFADAHGNNVGDIDHLFAENVVVKVILDITSGMAFVQNADTNTYLEKRFDGLSDSIICDSYGEVVAVNDAAKRPLQGLTVYGKTTQNGTPSPESPVPLESVGDSGSIGVTVTGKNLFALYKYGGSLAVNGVTVTVNNDGTILMNGTATADSWVEVLYGFMSATNQRTDKLVYLNPDSDYVLSRTDISGSLTGKASVSVQITDSSNISLPSTDKYVVFKGDGVYRGWIRLYNGAVFDNYKFAVQLEVGSAATAYEKPVAHQTLTASVPNGLHGIGEVKDYKDYTNGVYVQKMKFHTFDGTESIDLITSNNQFRWRVADIKPSTSNAVAGHILCSSYHVYPFDMASKVDIGVFASTAEQIRFKNTNYTNAEDFKASLIGQTIVYELAKPIEMPIPAEEMLQYSTLHTNKPNTTVFNDAGAEMAVSYVADTKLYIDNKFTELQNAILATGANI